VELKISEMSVKDCVKSLQTCLEKFARPNLGATRQCAGKLPTECNGRDMAKYHYYCQMFGPKRGARYCNHSSLKGQ